MNKEIIQEGTTNKGGHNNPPTIERPGSSPPAQAGFMQVAVPDYYIKIGIADNEIVAIDWADMPEAGRKPCNKEVIKYLKQAIKRMKRGDKK